MSTEQEAPCIEHCPYGYDFEHEGILCHIAPKRIADMTALNGYAQVPKGAFLEGKNYSDMIPMPPRWLERKLGDFGAAPPIIPLFLEMARIQRAGGKIERNRVSLDTVILVHGGITWSGPIRDHDGWWFGFDTMHGSDLDWDGLNPKWLRTEEYVVEQTKKLAVQILAYEQMVHGD